MGQATALDAGFDRYDERLPLPLTNPVDRSDAFKRKVLCRKNGLRVPSETALDAGFHRHDRHGFCVV